MSRAINYKCPPLVDCHEANLKIQRKRDQDKLERRHILTTEEQLKDQNGYEGSNKINIAKGTTDPRVEFISQVPHKS